MPLPDDAKHMLTNVNTDQAPSARGLADLAGNLGETYALTADQTLHLLSKRLGESYRHVALPFAAISAMSVEDDRPFAYMTVKAEGADYRMKFAGLDLKTLNGMRDAWAAVRGADAAPETADAPGQISAPSLRVATAATPDPQTPLDALLGFCACLQMLIRIDGSIDAEEMHLVHRALDNVEVVARGIEYLQDHDEETLLAELKTLLKGNQKLCLVANLLEIAMADGYLRREERQFIQRVCDSLGVKDDTYKAIYDVLIIKNDLSVLSMKKED